MDSVYRNGGKAGGVFKSQDYKGITKALRVLQIGVHLVPSLLLTKPFIATSILQSCVFHWPWQD